MQQLSSADVELQNWWVLAPSITHELSENAQSWSSNGQSQQRRPFRSCCASAVLKAPRASRRNGPASTAKVVPLPPPTRRARVPDPLCKPLKPPARKCRPLDGESAPKTDTAALYSSCYTRPESKGPAATANCTALTDLRIAPGRPLYVRPHLCYRSYFCKNRTSNPVPPCASPAPPAAHPAEAQPDPPSATLPANPLQPPSLSKTVLQIPVPQCQALPGPPYQPHARAS